MLSQSASHVFMIKPSSFGFNRETASTNSFQKNVGLQHAQRLALKEFNNVVEVLMNNKISVTVFNDTETPAKPDAVFPNNWISLQDDRIILYPMCHKNRRAERRQDIVDHFKSTFHVRDVFDLSANENHGMFLEGTGSLVFDHINRLAYACLSPRTNKKLAKELCKKLGYELQVFNAYSNGESIYHTNVIMCIGSAFAVVCLDCIDDLSREFIRESLHNSKELIPISIDQMNAFAGNMLEVKNMDGKPFILLSNTAYAALYPDQKDKLSRHGQLLPIAIPTIEKVGGGGIRCMLTEVFLNANV